MSPPKTLTATVWQLSRCSCGRFTLRLGATRIDLHRNELMQLKSLVDEAVERLDAEVPAPAVTH